MENKDDFRTTELICLAKRIKDFDHTYQMSDDHSVWLKGAQRKDQLMTDLFEAFEKRSNALEFWNKYAPEGFGYRQDYIDELKELGQ